MTILPTAIQPSTVSGLL